MCTKMKGLCKGVKYLSQMLVVKEPELEIGYPTDVKHVAHIGADGIGTATPPSWMNGFKNGTDFSANSEGSFKENKSPSSNEIKQSTSKVDSATAQKKHRRKKPKPRVSSPKAS